VFFCQVAFAIVCTLGDSMSAASINLVTSSRLVKRAKHRKEKKELESLRKENEDLRDQVNGLMDVAVRMRDRWNARESIINKYAMLILKELLDRKVVNGVARILSIEADEILSSIRDYDIHLFSDSNRSKAIKDVFVKIVNYAKKNGLAIS
jgi:hypothetical protein